MADLSILHRKIRSYFDREDAADIEAEDYDHQVQSQSSDPHPTKTSRSETKTSSYVQGAFSSVEDA